MVRLLTFSFRLPEPLSFVTVGALDILDVLLVSYIIYRVFHLMKGTRAMQMLFGILVLILMSVLAKLYRLPGTSWIIDSIRTVWVVAFVILFQPEIRNGLTQVGRNRFLGIFLGADARSIELAAEACRALAEKGAGAIIVFEKNDGLKNYIDSGVEIGARVSSQLLVTLFSTEGPLHDGAVIIRGDTILAAGCTLPISPDQSLTADYGMRHRAAVGLSEETDAVVAVVSEERQSFSLARYGKLHQIKDIMELKARLHKALHAKSGKKEMAAAAS
jgi:diadenylate cyclase